LSLEQTILILVHKVVAVIKMTKFFYTIFIIIISFWLGYIAMAAEQIDFPNPSYIFYLYYDNGQLFADRDYEIKYDVIPEVFVPETITAQFPYRGEVVNLLNQVVSVFQFDPKGGNIKFVKGKLTAKAPYAPDGQKVNFYDSQGKQLVSIFVSQSSFCNDDGICNSDTGEDTTTCRNDCKLLQTPPPTVAPTVPSSGGGPPGLATVLIYSLIGGGAAFGGWYAWRLWRKKKSAGTVIPPSQLPGNPTL